jgi:hypothetical protein
MTAIQKQMADKRVVRGFAFIMMITGFSSTKIVYGQQLTKQRVTA